MGRFPMSGKMSRSSRRMILLPCASTQFWEYFSYHSRDTASKLLAACSWRSDFCALRLWPGSIRFASSFRASSRRSRASFRPTSGKVPKDNNFSLPSKRYLRRHHLPPLGVTSRNSPRSSYNFTGLAPGWALRMVVLVNAIVGVTVLAPPGLPQGLPPSESGCRWTILDHAGFRT